MIKNVSELRQDLVSGDWVVIATARAKRPHDFLKRKHRRVVQPKKDCPFETLKGKKVLLQYQHSNNSGRNNKKNENNWFVAVIPNKYPAFGEGLCMVERHETLFNWMDGVGFHEVLVYRDHSLPLALFNQKETELVLKAYQSRFLNLSEKDCVEYILIFHNDGPEAGATISHPHSQLIAVPIIPPDVARSIAGSKRYFENRQECVHCVMVNAEKSSGKRIIYENERFLSVAPFVSRTAFEIRIFPKNHQPSFEKISHEDVSFVADALRISLKKLYIGLKDPCYNFFIHTAPCRGEQYQHYHWHIEILPKTAIWAGFELGTGIEIATIAPETAAEYLRGIKAE